MLTVPSLSSTTFILTHGKFAIHEYIKRIGLQRVTWIKRPLCDTDNNPVKSKLHKKIKITHGSTIKTV